MFSVAFEQNSGGGSGVPTTRALVGGTGILTIGDLSADRTIAVDTSVISTKAYVDALFQSRDWKDSVRAITAAALPAYTRVANVITANANGALPAINGITLIANDRLALKDGAFASDNFLYTVTQVGNAGTPFILTRTIDADTSAKVTPRAAFEVEEGTNAGFWIISNTGTITLNTTAITIIQAISATDLASPGPIGGTTPAAITGTTITGNTSVLSNLHDARTSSNLSIGTSTASAITIGQASVATTVAGNLQVNTGTILYAQSGATYFQISNGGLTSYAYNTPITVSASDTLTLESRAAGASLDASGNVTLGGNTATAVNIGRSAGTIALNATATLAANKGITFAAGSGVYNAGSATGDTTFGTGSLQWTSATGKFLVFTSSDVTSFTTTGGSSYVQLDGSIGIKLKRSGYSYLDLGTITPGQITVGADCALKWVNAGGALFDMSSQSGLFKPSTGAFTWTGAAGANLSLVAAGSETATVTSGSTATFGSTGGTATFVANDNAIIQSNNGYIRFRQGNSTVLMDYGVTTGSTWTVKAPLAMSANQNFSAAAGTSALNFGSATGATTLSTGDFSWSGASGKSFYVGLWNGNTAINAYSSTLSLGSGSVNVVFDQSANIDWTAISNQNKHVTFESRGTAAGAYSYFGHYSGGYVKFQDSGVGTSAQLLGAGSVSVSSNGGASLSLYGSFTLQGGQSSSISTYGTAKTLTIDTTGGTYLYKSSTLVADFGVTSPTALTMATGTKLALDSSTATGSGLAVTLNKQAGKITTESLSTNPQTSDTYTITNSLVTTASQIICTPMKGTNTVPWTITNVTPGTGSFTIQIYNLYPAGGGAINGTVVFSFLII